MHQCSTWCCSEKVMVAKQFPQHCTRLQLTVNSKLGCYPMHPLQVKISWLESLLSQIDQNAPICHLLFFWEVEKTDGCKTISPTDCGFQIGMTTFTFFLQRQVSEVYLPWHFSPVSLKGFLNNGELCRALRSQCWDSLLQIEKRILWWEFLLNTTLL